VAITLIDRIAKASKNLRFLEVKTAFSISLYRIGFRVAKGDGFHLLISTCLQNDKRAIYVSE
jgi:hypothetical protein